LLALLDKTGEVRPQPADGVTKFCSAADAIRLGRLFVWIAGEAWAFSTAAEKGPDMAGNSTFFDRTR
jgi:hypothetical protein